MFFGSLHGTLNHLLATDRIWFKRLTGQGEAPARVDVVRPEDRHDLARARIAEDARLIATVAAYDEAALAQPLAYRTTSGVAHEQTVADILAHLFNHQTHRRGQAHAALSILTGREPPSLDLLQFQRGVAAPDLATRLKAEIRDTANRVFASEAKQTSVCRNLLIVRKWLTSRRKTQP